MMNEFEKFKSVPNKKESFWLEKGIQEQYPILSPIALSYLTLPPSSASAERAASILRFVQEDKRTLLNEYHINEELLYSFNKDIIFSEASKFVQSMEKTEREM